MILGGEYLNIKIVKGGKIFQAPPPPKKKETLGIHRFNTKFFIQDFRLGGG